MVTCSLKGLIGKDIIYFPLDAMDESYDHLDAYVCRIPLVSYSYDFVVIQVMGLSSTVRSLLSTDPQQGSLGVDSKRVPPVRFLLLW
jgi:hypothetical protein